MVKANMIISKSPKIGRILASTETNILKVLSDGPKFFREIKDLFCHPEMTRKVMRIMKKEGKLYNKFRMWGLPGMEKQIEVKNENEKIKEKVEPTEVDSSFKLKVLDFIKKKEPVNPNRIRQNFNLSNCSLVNSAIGELIRENLVEKVNSKSKRFKRFKSVNKEEYSLRDEVIKSLDDKPMTSDDIVALFSHHPKHLVKTALRNLRKEKKLNLLDWKWYTVIQAKKEKITWFVKYFSEEEQKRGVDVGKREPREEDVLVEEGFSEIIKEIDKQADKQAEDHNLEERILIILKKSKIALSPTKIRIKMQMHPNTCKMITSKLDNMVELGVLDSEKFRAYKNYFIKGSIVIKQPSKEKKEELKVEQEEKKISSDLLDLIDYQISKKRKVTVTIGNATIVIE